MNYTFITILIIILILLFLYTNYLVKRLLKLFLTNKTLYISLSLITTILILIPILFRINFIILIILIYVMISTFIIDIIYFMSTKFLKLKINNYIKILKNSLIIQIIFSLSFSYYGYYNAKNIIKTEYDITSNKISEEYKIGFISDVHFGNTLTIKELEEYSNKLNNENFDIVILGGDIVDESTIVEDYESIFKILGNIKNKYGIYYIYGNHDENKYITTTDDRNTKLINFIEKANIKILNEESTLINNDIILTGRIDYSYNNEGVRKNAYDIIKSIDKNKYLIVADHQPYYYQENKNAGFDLQISGHTHAGQIWPFGLVTSSLGFDYGILNEEDFKLIVSSGFGVWGMPIRTEEKSEYVVINIRNKKQ